TAFRASCLKSASDRKLLVGFSDDRRFFVPILVLLVFFFLVIIIVGMSRRHRVTAPDRDEGPNVLPGPWSHFRLPCGFRVSWRSYRAFSCPPKRLHCCPSMSPPVTE